MVYLPVQVIGIITIHHQIRWLIKRINISLDLNATIAKEFNIKGNLSLKFFFFLHSFLVSFRGIRLSLNTCFHKLLVISKKILLEVLFFRFYGH